MSPLFKTQFVDGKPVNGKRMESSNGGRGFVRISGKT